MPYDWSIDRHTSTAYVRATGPSSYEESADALTRLSGDPDFESDTKVLLDVRQHEYSPSLSDGRRLITLLNDLGMHNRIGVLVASKLHFGVGRQLSLMGSLNNLTIEVFTESETVENWLKAG